jgi:hypothetical protein
MNKVNNRKMFSKRDARNRLSEMGGILSSSPELLGEVQKFANGGPAYLSQYQPNRFAAPDRRRLEDSAFRQYGMNLNADNTLSPYKTASDALYDRTMAGQSGPFSASQAGEEENEFLVKAQLIEKFGDRTAENILNTAKELRAKARIVGEGVKALATFIPEAVGMVQSTLGFTEAGAQRFEDASKLRQKSLNEIVNIGSNLLDLSDEGRSLSLMPDMSIDRYGLNIKGGDSPRERIRRLNAKRETANQIEYDAGLPALRQKLSALEDNDPMGVLSDTFVEKIQRPEGGYSAEMSKLSPAPGQAEAIFGTGSGAGLAGFGFKDFEQLAKDNPEMMAANRGMLQAQDEMTTQGIINSLDPASRAALSAQQDLTREEYLNRMPVSQAQQLNTLPSEQALAEASDYSTARDIARANEAKGINPQGPNLLPEQKEEQTYLSRILEAGKKDISNLVEGGKKVADVVSNVGESITDFDKNMANKVKEKRERDALNAEQNAEAKKFIDEMNLADKNLPSKGPMTSEEKDTMREEYLNRIPDSPEVDENNFLSKIDGYLTAADNYLFGGIRAGKVAEKAGDLITPKKIMIAESNNKLTQEQLDELALADKNEEITANSNGEVVTKPVAEKDILNLVQESNNTLDVALGGTGTDSKTTTLAQKNKEMQKLYQEMFGEDEKEVAAAKWNQLAMVGFAIAAGKDPNALTNVAAGLLEGAKQTRKDVATRKARRDKIKMSAFDAALSGVAADKKFGRDLTIAKMRLDATGGYSKDQNPNRTFYQLLQTYTDAYAKTYEMSPPLGNDGQDLTGTALSDFIKKKATEDALSTVQLRTPGFNLQNYAPPDDDSSIPTISTKEEFDALPSGAEFYQKGATGLRRKP